MRGVTELIVLKVSHFACFPHALFLPLQAVLSTETTAVLAKAHRLRLPPESQGPAMAWGIPSAGGQVLSSVLLLHPLEQIKLGRVAGVCT